MSSRYFRTILALTGWLAAAAVQAEGSEIRLEQNAAGAWVVRAVNAGSAPFTLSVDTDAGVVPTVLGSLSKQGSDRIFTPRFPLDPRIRYRATLGSRPPVTALLQLPAALPAVSARVLQIYPETDVVPANLLKFYIHFSEPMARGEAYRRIHLLDEAGKEVDMPFLQLDQELWDPELKRLTLLFDPGRVKSDLQPTREVGPALKAGHAYTLVIDAAWTDARGRPLASDHRKPFRVAEADKEPPDPASWQLTVPAAGGVQPLVLEFPEPLDHALALRLIAVTDDAGRPLEGAARLDQADRRWLYQPAQPWQAGEFAVTVNPGLEDLAANRIRRLFEVKGKRSEQERAESHAVSLPFRIPSPSP